jgi:hypothetical protein
MRKTGLFTLGIVATLVLIVVAASWIGGGSSRGDVGEAEGLSKDLTVQLADGSATADADFDSAYASEAATGPLRDEVAPPLPGLTDRKLVRDATVRLDVEDVLASVQQVQAIATGAGGFVSASSVFVDQPANPSEDAVSERRTQSATVTIRVPSSVYDSVMSQLREIADEVRSESSTTSDVTEEFTDLAARLRNLEATEARYLELLGRAETIEEILTVQDRINSVRLETETVQGRINVLNDLSDLATIVVQLQPPTAAVEAPSEPGWAQEAWDNAWEESREVLEGLGTAAIVGGVVLAWLAVPALAIALGWRLLGPRRPSSGEAGGSGGTTA